MPIHDVLRQRMQPLTAAMTSNRIFFYCVFSTFAVAATIANACRAQSNFYSVSIYLSRSSRSVLVLANFGFLCALLCGRILQKIFFGNLQPREVERLYDQTWMFVTESLLAFTIFRDEFDVPFLLMFGFLLFVKCFHWLMADRVESMDQTTYPGPPTLFHVRINSLFFVLWAVDSLMFAFAVESTLTNGVGGMVLFASEYAILLASALNAILRYVLSLLDLRRARSRGGENAPPWENKSMYIFYIELLTDFLKLATYMTFFMIILTFYGLPLNIIRDVFVTARSFITRLRALIRYHNATRDMDRRYPDATEAELAEMSDRTCIICREEMQSRNAPNPAAPPGPPPNDEQQPAQQPNDGPNMTPKKLPCGHIFHFQCLRSWLERQQSCPTCRRTVLETNTPQTQNQAPGQGQAQARAARPRPGAAPLPGGLPGQQGAGGAANPFGWVGRIFGVPPQPPALNGQFPGVAQGPAFQQQPQQQQQPVPPPNAGWGAPIPGHAAPLPPPYYAPPPMWQHHVPGQPPQQHLQPPPMYRGFYGPGHAWQPWGDPRWYAPPPQPHLPVQQGQQPPEGQDPSNSQASMNQNSNIPLPTPTVVVDERGEHPTQRGVSSQAPTPTPIPSEATSNAATDQSTVTHTHTSETDADERPTDARAAAALAALRRRGIGPTTTSDAEISGRSTSVSVPGSSSETAPTSPERTRQPSPHPSTSRAPVSATSEPSTSSPSAVPVPPSSSSQPPTQETPSLPSLIPLYDPNQVPGANPYYSPFSHYYHPSAAGVPPLYPGVPQPFSQQSLQALRTQVRSIRSSQGSSSSSARTPLAQLPPTLTDEQLARLDRLTRDAIDERLRVLEGVSSTIHRCMEELTRVRSVLPAGSSARRARGQQAPTAASASASGSVAASGATSDGATGAKDLGASSEGEDERTSSSLSDGELVDAPNGGSRDVTGASGSAESS